jgi:hypothetical protein
MPLTDVVLMIRPSTGLPPSTARASTRGPAARPERALQVHGDDRVPLLLGHVDEHAVAQDAGVVDDRVQVAERLDRGVDEALRALPRGDAVAVRDRLAAHALDLVDDLLRR